MPQHISDANPGAEELATRIIEKVSNLEGVLSTEVYARTVKEYVKKTHCQPKFSDLGGVGVLACCPSIYACMLIHVNYIAHAIVSAPVIYSCISFLYLLCQLVIIPKSHLQMCSNASIVVERDRLLQEKKASKHAHAVLEKSVENSQANSSKLQYSLALCR